MRLPAMWAFDRKRDTWQGFKDDCLGIQAGLYRLPRLWTADQNIRHARTFAKLAAKHH